MLILESHITFNFPGGVRTLYPPSGSAHVTNYRLVIDRRDFTYSYTVLVKKSICRIGQAQSPEPKGLYSPFLDNDTYPWNWEL